MKVISVRTLLTVAAGSGYVLTLVPEPPHTATIRWLCPAVVDAQATAAFIDYGRAPPETSDLPARPD